MTLRNCKIAAFLVAVLLGNPAQAADLPIVAVAQFESTVDNEGYFRTESNPDNYEAMLETQLIKVGRFTVYERNKLDQVLGEQGLQQSLSNNGTQLQIEGVDYLVYGSITKKSTQQKQLQTGQFASVKVVSTFGVDIKIVDATTGEIRRAEAIEASVEAGQGVATGNFRSIDASGDGLVEAQRLVAKKSAALLAESIFPIRVVDVDEPDIYLNYGDSILSVGDQVTLVREGREIVDQDTGKVLGSRERVLGTLEIISADANMSIAKKVGGSFEVGTGDRAKISLTVNQVNSSKQREKKGRRI
jgi:curli biogenesis system outer membrane secretion channel CsgG